MQLELGADCLVCGLCIPFLQERMYGLQQGGGIGEEAKRLQAKRITVRMFEVESGGTASSTESVPCVRILYEVAVRTVGVHGAFGRSAGAEFQRGRNVAVWAVAGLWQVSLHTLPQENMRGDNFSH